VTALTGTRYYAIAEYVDTGVSHRLAQTSNGSLRFITAPDVALRTFARDDFTRVRDFCASRGMRLYRWRAINPYPWLEVDHDTKLPHPAVARGLNAIGNRIHRHLRINEGTRTRARQQALWDDAVRRYGSEAAAARWVARPGTSRHEDHDGDGWGDAADVVDALDGENLRPMLERRGLMGWVRDELGLTFPMDYEPWHLERTR
jgi:hypothetical protein